MRHKLTLQLIIKTAMNQMIRKSTDSTNHTHWLNLKHDSQKTNKVLAEHTEDAQRVTAPPSLPPQVPNIHTRMRDYMRLHSPPCLPKRLEGVCGVETGVAAWCACIIHSRHQPTLLQQVKASAAFGRQVKVEQAVPPPPFQVHTRSIHVKQIRNDVM